MGDNLMPNACPHCAQVFSLWVLYNMHLETHRMEARAMPKQKGTYTREEKAAIVARGERRLGVQHFYGGTK